MTAQRWRQIESLFERALELPEPERAAQAATRAETAARKEAEALVQKERARVRQLEEQSKKITNELR